ncbi:MAG TPA: proteasome subunit beta, partial [Candidatus Nanopusillus sp.]|nr:proteasome subunit beta [Candidatus Nanopusillus sp.]
MQERKTGTTVVAIRTKEGIVIASDKRVSWGYLVYSKEGEKITQITDNIVIAAAGVYADLQFLSKILSANLKLKEL